jgi:hypothetical protein
MALATVAPSLVILTPPNDWSMSTFLPLGPNVTCTALASASQPYSILVLAVLPKTSYLAEKWYLSWVERVLIMGVMVL